MITVTKAPDDIYDITILLKGKVNTYSIYIKNEWLCIPVADIEYYFHQQGIKDARVLSLTKVKEIIKVT